MFMFQMNVAVQVQRTVWVEVWMGVAVQVGTDVAVHVEFQVFIHIWAVLGVVPRVRGGDGDSDVTIQKH